MCKHNRKIAKIIYQCGKTVKEEISMCPCFPVFAYVNAFKQKCDYIYTLNNKQGLIHVFLFVFIYDTVFPASISNVDEAHKERNLVFLVKVVPDCVRESVDVAFN